MIDLRSDTVTQPTDAMRRAMAEAPVGDDVFGEDPTIRALEERTAEVLGTEAAVYMPSGTMTNQVALRCWTQAGDEVLLADNAHIFHYEGGAPAAISGVLCRMLPTVRGIFGPEDIHRALRPKNVHYAPARLVCVENTSNRGGGSIWPPDQLGAVAEFARDHGLAVHMDGARLWNAAVAVGLPESRWAQYCDSISVCFSKGLGAPVGSALAGSAELVDRARRFRKMLGGGMRQAGLIAAGALYALENHRSRLADDHANARTLAEGLAEMDGVQIDPEVETNIVLFNVTAIPAAELVEVLSARGVGVLATGAREIRAVTNLSVSAEQIDQALAAFREILSRL